MAGGIAALRPSLAPVFAITNSVETLRQLRIMRSVEPFLMPLDAANPNQTIENAIEFLTKIGKIHDNDKLVIVTDILSSDRLIDSVQLRTV